MNNRNDVSIVGAALGIAALTAVQMSALNVSADAEAAPTVTVSAQSQAGEYVLRVDCGADKEYKDPRGNTWKADQSYVKGTWGYVGGTTVDRGAIEVGHSDMPKLFQSERYGLAEYRASVSNGRYTVGLLFAETWEGIRHPGGRAFDVLIQQKIVLPKFDPVKEAGFRNAIVRIYETEVTNGELVIGFQAAQQSPLINAFEVRSGSCAAEMTKELAGVEVSAPATSTVEKSNEEFLAAKADRDWLEAFRELTIPNGSMQADRDEMILRCQARDIGLEIFFLDTLNAMQVSREQVEKLLLFARKARELCEERTVEIRDLWTRTVENLEGYKMRCAGDSECGCSMKYGLYESGKGLKFRDDLRKLEKAVADQVFTPEQIEKATPKIRMIKDGSAGGTIPLPFQYRQGIWWMNDFGKVGVVAYLLIAPNAVGRCELALGRDATESAKRAESNLLANASISQLERSIWNLHRRKVTAANVLSGLNLTEKQLRDLIVANKKAGEVQAAHSEINKKPLRLLVAKLAEMRDLLATGKTVTKEMKMECVAFQKQICRGPCHMLCPMHHEYTDQMTRINDRVQFEILHDEQARLVWIVESCFAASPPSWASDPVRVGEVARVAIYAEQTEMKEIRSMPKNGYSTARDAFAARILDKAGKNLDGNKKMEELKRVQALIDKAAGMTDTEFELSKYDWVSDLLRKRCPEMTGRSYPSFASVGDSAGTLSWDNIVSWQEKTGVNYWDIMKELRRRGDPIPKFYEKPIYIPYHGWRVTIQDRIMMLVVDPDHIPVYEVLLAKIRNYKPSAPTDLDQLKVAAEMAPSGNSLVKSE